MTDCPFHDLPPDQTVLVRYENGPELPYEARRMCTGWHVAEALEPARQAFLDWFDSTVLTHTNIPPALHKHRSGSD